MDIDTIFTRGAVQHLAGPRFFERGASYAASGRVKKLKVGDDAVTATVRGQRPYQVRLWIEDGGPAYSCTCPVGEGELFCKHCVAVGLAFVNRDEEPTAPGIAGDDSASIDLRLLDSISRWNVDQVWTRSRISGDSGSTLKGWGWLTRTMRFGRRFCSTSTTATSKYLVQR